MLSKLVGRKDERKVEPSNRRSRADSERRPTRTTFERAILGMKGGLIATLVMTAYRLPISQSLPPTANFWARYVGGGDSDQYTVQGIVLHLLYGAVAGGVFGVIVPESGTDPTVERELRDVAWGLGYAIALSAFGSRVMLGRVLGMDLEADEALVFHLGHVVYGLTLGTWLGSRSGRYSEALFR